MILYLVNFNVINKYPRENLSSSENIKHELNFPIKYQRCIDGLDYFVDALLFSHLMISFLFLDTSKGPSINGILSENWVAMFPFNWTGVFLVLTWNKIISHDAAEIPEEILLIARCRANCMEKVSTAYLILLLSLTYGSAIGSFKLNILTPNSFSIFLPYPYICSYTHACALILRIGAQIYTFL